MNRIRLILVIAVLVLVVTVSGVQPAGAAFNFADGFENNPLATWTIESYPYIPTSTSGEAYTNHGSFSTFAGYARTGSNYVYMTAGNNTSWWSAVGRRLYVPLNTSCMLTFYVMPWYKTRNNVRVEVIDPATWNYISYKDFTVDYTGGGYKAVNTNWWATTKLPVYVRLALSGGTYLPGYSYTPTIGVDDMSVYCPFA